MFYDESSTRWKRRNGIYLPGCMALEFLIHISSVQRSGSLDSQAIDLEEKENDKN